jgi:hypothetical protein
MTVLDRTGALTRLSRTCLAAVTGLIFLPALSAQTMPVAGPTAGYVFDPPTGSLRQAVGAMGSASLGPVVVRDLAFASVAPSSTFAIACQDLQCFVLSGLGGDALTSAPLPALAGVADGVSWSSSGSMAVVYSKSANWIQVLTGLPSSVQVGPPLSIVPLGGSLVAAAIRGDGGRVAIAIAGDHAGVLQVTSSSSFVPLLTAQVSALAFSSSGTLYALDVEAREIFELDSDGGQARQWTAGDLEDPVALQPSRDASGRSVVYIAGGSDRALVAVDTTTHQAIDRIALAFPPSRIEPLNETSFLLTTRATQDDVLWSFTPGRGVYFVPAAHIDTDTRGPRRRR